MMWIDMMINTIFEVGKGVGPYVIMVELLLILLELRKRNRK